MSNKKSKKGGFFLGAILGAIAGLLFAPKSGKATRADIKRTGKNGKEHYYEEYNNLLNLQDLASDIELSKEDREYAQIIFENAYKEFDKKCKGEYITFPIVNKDGTHELKQKKIKEGIYERIIPTFTEHLNYIQAIVKLRDLFNITEPDETLCCSKSCYEDLLKDRTWLIEKIKAYQKQLKEVNKKISDYEIVHEGNKCEMV